jgi:FixJ family two-component response regulator
MPTKVLIVEPDSTLRTSFVGLLETSGFDVIEARTFLEARRMLRDDAPGVLVTEVRLAGFNGLRLIVTGPRLTPSVVMGYADPVLQAEALRLGAAYLRKPVSQADLLVAIDRQLATFSGTGISSFKRRWIRKTVTADLSASVDDTPARVVDVSYGGLGVEIDRPSGNPPPRTFSVKLTAAGLNVPADLVWITRISERSWRCGVALSRMGQIEASTWRGLVDLIPESSKL